MSDSPHPPESSRNNGQKKVIQWKQPPSYTNIKPHFPMSRQFFREIILDILRYLLLCSFIIYQCVCVCLLISYGGTPSFDIHSYHPGFFVLPGGRLLT